MGFAAVRVGGAGVEAEADVSAPPPLRTALTRIALAHSILIGQRILMRSVQWIVDYYFMYMYTRIAFILYQHCYFYMNTELQSSHL